MKLLADSLLVFLVMVIAAAAVALAEPSEPATRADPPRAPAAVSFPLASLLGLH
jgi:hypothetical protein